MSTPDVSHIATRQRAVMCLLAGALGWLFLHAGSWLPACPLPQAVRYIWSSSPLCQASFFIFFGACLRGCLGSPDRAATTFLCGSRPRRCTLYGAGTGPVKRYYANFFQRASPCPIGAWPPSGRWGLAPSPVRRGVIYVHPGCTSMHFLQHFLHGCIAGLKTFPLGLSHAEATRQ